MYTKNLYQNQRIQSLSNAEVCHLLWQKVSENLDAALRFIEEGNVPKKLEKIDKTFQIFDFLSLSVSSFLPPHVAETNRSLLEALGAQLVMANSKNDKSAYQRIRGIALEQAETWKEVSDTHKNAGFQDTQNPVVPSGPINVCV